MLATAALNCVWLPLCCLAGNSSRLARSKVADLHSQGNGKTIIANSASTADSTRSAHKAAQLRENLAQRQSHPPSSYVDDIASAFAEQDRPEWEEMKRAFDDKNKIEFRREKPIGSDEHEHRARSQGLHSSGCIKQSHAETVLAEFGMQGKSTVRAQSELSKQQCSSTPEEIEQMRKISYRQAVGSLMYLANCTRPDLAHAVQLVAQFSQNPGAEHWRAVLQILRYLSSTTHYGLLFGATASQIEPLCSHRVSLMQTGAAAADSRRSTTGWLIQLCGGWIDWSCKKQEIVALSSCEAEYVTASSDRGSRLDRQRLREIGFLEWLPGVRHSPR